MPASAAPPQAQAEAQGAPPACPPYEERILKERELLKSLPEECIRVYKQAERQAAAYTTVSDVGNVKISGYNVYGYTYNDSSVPFNWIDATTNSGLTGDDRFQGPVDIGFAFPFYGLTESSLYFSTNGLITFDAGSAEWNNNVIPHDRNPNNFIAAFWEDMLVGAPYNGGGIYYSGGGAALNRYFVVEWRGVTNYETSRTFSFEVILYENGDIVVQHRSLPSAYSSAVGLEDYSGYDGLQYQRGSSGLSAPRAIRFYYPTTASVQVVAYSTQPAGFLPLDSTRDFPVTVINRGRAGTDTYQVYTASPYWPITYHSLNGAPLTDTDGDTVIDTGPVPQGMEKTILARISVPPGAVVGDLQYPWVGFQSTLSGAAFTEAQLFMMVPSGSAQVLVNNTDGAMSFLTASVDAINSSKATANNYFGADPAVIQMTNGNYFYAWEKATQAPNGTVRNIEYAILNRQGALVRAPGKLTDNSGANVYTSDGDPSIAMTPNGTVGMAWYRYLYNTSTNKFNYNIFFATLNAAGTRLTGPTNITNNSVWGGIDSLNIPLLYSPTIAATSDNRFILSWEDERRVNASTSKYNVWYALRNPAGTSVLPPTALTGNDMSFGPVLNSLTGSKVILTWLTDVGGPYYAVLNSGGAVSKPATSLHANTIYYTPDAVQLPNGRVAVAWGTETGMQFSILNSSYSPISGPTTGISPDAVRGYGLSVTTDSSSRVIMTWLDGDNDNRQLYALGDSNGVCLTPPLFYNWSRDYIDVNWNGQGNAPFQGSLVISGSTSLATNTTLNYTGGTATGSSDGYYSLKVPFGWSGTVTPVRTGFRFEPLNRTYSNVTTDLTFQDYGAYYVYSISGNAGAAGVTLSYTDGTPKTVVSQADGSYSLIVSIGWSGTVTPTHPCFTFSPANQSYSSVSADETAQDYTATAASGCADINVSIGGTDQGRFGLSSPGSTRVSFPGLSNGPVKVQSTNGASIIGAERVIYKVNNLNASFTEMMGLPASQLDTTYWLPWYNNIDLDTQLRIANVSNSSATVHVFIGGTEVTPVSGLILAAGASTRWNFPGVNGGPVKIVSNQNIVATGRVIYKVGGVNTSFSEMMALPASQLDTTYWLPWYNNIDLDTQLRIANVSNNPATVQVFIGNTEVSPVGGIPLAAGQSTRLTYAGVNNGPVKIVSTEDIVASERVIYKVNNINTSFTEMMALPNGQLDMIYWLPWYNNVDLDTQLRFANTTNQVATVHIFIGGVEQGSGFTLQPNASTRQSFPTINNGPMQIVSDVPIVVTERVIYKVNGINTSFTEMMALPNSQLDTTYRLPWYNNVDLDTQLRFGVP